jgi:hypothetical protein
MTPNFYTLANDYPKTNSPVDLGVTSDFQWDASRSDNENRTLEIQRYSTKVSGFSLTLGALVVHNRWSF